MQIPAAHFPVASVFDPSSYGPFSPHGAPGGEYQPPTASTASTVDVPSTPRLTGKGWKRRSRSVQGTVMPLSKWTSKKGTMWYVREAVPDAGQTQVELVRWREFKGPW